MGFHFLMPAPGLMLIQGAMTNAIKAWFSAVESHINSTAILEFIKANELDPLPRINGPDPKTGLPRPASPAFTRYLTDGATNAVYLLPGTGPNAAATTGLPQATLAVSLTTSLFRGPAHRGRVYPPTSTEVSNDGRTPVIRATECAGTMVTLLAALNAANAGRVVVYSAVGGPSTVQVLGVSVGRVIDTQRRRRRNLLEEYSSAPIV